MNFVISIQNFLFQVYQIVESIARVALLSKWNVRITPISSQKKLIILANGPSLISDIEKNSITTSDLLCVNHFPTTELFQKIKPAYYVTAVPELWLQDVAQKYLDQRKALLDVFSTKTNWPIIVFLPFASRSNPEWNDTLKKNKNITILYFNNTPVEGPTWFSFWGFRKNLGMPRPHNVLVPSLMIGINMGYKKIDLYGVDHSWLPEITVDGNNQVLLHQKHFYDEGKSTHQPMDIKGRGKRDLSQVLHKFMHTFAGYHTINNYAKAMNAKIHNHTKGSFIDAFERA